MKFFFFFQNSIKFIWVSFQFYSCSLCGVGMQLEKLRSQGPTSRRFIGPFWWIRATHWKRPIKGTDKRENLWYPLVLFSSFLYEHLWISKYVLYIPTLSFIIIEILCFNLCLLCSNADSYDVKKNLLFVRHHNLVSILCYYYEYIRQKSSGSIIRVEFSKRRWCIAY